jgi:hypothetical protein
MHSVTSLFRLICLLILAFFPAISMAQSSQDIRFPRGASSTTIDGSIRGDRGINYRIGVSAGQRMSVQLDTDNASNTFNVTAPGASEALFIGSTCGNSTSFTVPSSGTYTISVYLMRNAARRGEAANYELTVSVESARATRPTTLPAQPVAPNYADGLDGGPDFWQVQGVAGGDTLNLRAGPSTSNSVGRNGAQRRRAAQSELYDERQHALVPDPDPARPAGLGCRAIPARILKPAKPPRHVALSRPPAIAATRVSAGRSSV